MSMAYTIKRYVGFVSLVLVFVVLISTEARADWYYEWSVVENNSKIPEVVTAELSLEVSDPGDGKVLFTFYNNNPDDAVNDFFISDIYFDDGHVTGIITDGTGIDNSNLAGYFELPATPSELPGGNTIWPEFETTSMEHPGTTPHYSANGVNGVYGGESVGIYMYTASDVSDVIDAIAVGFDPVTYYQDGNGEFDGWYERSLRIAIKVQGIGDYSDTYILTPEPASLLLGSIGIGMVIARCRKRKTLIES